MASLEPITQDEFLQIAQEEGVPLPIAASLYGIESGFGKNPEAYISAQERADAFNAKQKPGTKARSANSFGVGSLQITKPTFGDFMPSVRFEEATDAQLTRAAMRLIKSQEAPDGSYDLQKLKTRFFGPGIDTIGGSDYKPSTNEKVARKFHNIMNNVSEFFEPGADLAEVALRQRGEDEPLSTSFTAKDPAFGIKVAQEQGAQAKVLSQFDPEAAAKKAQESGTNFFNSLWAASQERIETAQIPLEVAGQNPQGNYLNAELALKTLANAQKRLIQTQADINFEGNYGTGIGGYLNAVIRNLGAKLQYPERVKQVKDLNAAVQETQANIQTFQNQALSTTPDPNQILQIYQEKRLIENQSLQSDARLAQLQVAEGNLRAREAEAAAREVGRQAQTAVSQAREELIKAQTAAVKAKLGLSESDEVGLEQMNAAGEKALKSIDPDAQFVPARSVKEFESIYLKTKTPQDKKLYNAVRAAMITGTATELDADPVAMAAVVSSRTADPVVSSSLGKIATDLAENQKIIANKEAQNFTKRSIATWEVYSARLDPKAAAEAEKNHKRRALEVLIKSPTDSRAFNRNPLNMFSMATYINAPNNTGLKELLDRSGIDANNVNSDQELFGRIAAKMAMKDMPDDNPTILSTLVGFYRNLALSRAEQNPPLKEMRITIPKNESSNIPYDYRIRDGKTIYDLTSQRDAELYLAKQKAVVMQHVHSQGGRSLGQAAFDSISGIFNGR